MGMDKLIKKLTGKRGELLDKFVKHDIQVEQKAAQRRADAYEGKIPKGVDTKGDDKDVIKALTERLPDDEIGSSGDRRGDRRDEPSRLKEPPEEDEIHRPEGGEEELENEKEYFGKKEDTFFYLITDTEEGENDLRIIDQDGNVVFSAKENDLDTTDVFHFILDAVPAIEPSEISYDIFVRYIKPKIEELEQEDEPEFDNSALDADAEVKQPFGGPKESVDEVKVQFSDHDFIVNIIEDAKETVLEINGRQFRFDEKFTDFFRNADSGKLTEDDVTELAKYVLSSLDKNEFEEISKTPVVKTDEACKDEPKKDKKKKKAKEGVISKAALMNEINIVTQGIKQLTRTAKDAMKAKDYAAASDASARLSAIHSALPEIEEKPEETKEEDKKSDDIVEPVEGIIPKETDLEKTKIDKLTEEDEPEEEKQAKKDNPDDEVAIDKKSKKKSNGSAPQCDKCQTKHWPFHGCKK